MSDIDEEQKPRLSDYCPVCKELMWNTENIGHICGCDVFDGALLYNPKTGEAYGQTDLEIIRLLNQGLTNGVQLHLRDAGIEADLVSMIKEHWGNENSRTRITRLFSAITWPPYDHPPGEGTFDL